MSSRARGVERGGAEEERERERERERGVCMCVLGANARLVAAHLFREWILLKYDLSGQREEH